MELYASWGVDFIKADDMGSHLYQPAEIKALHRAILRSGRPIVLSISPGHAPVQEAEFFQKHAQMWRISDDFWDEWRLLRQQFDYARDWAPEIGKGNTWPDADMLAIGRLRLAANGGKGEASKFTPDEQRTMMTLWSILRSPLMMGGDLPQCDAFTLSLLSNPEVIAVDQHSRDNRPILRGDFTVWAAETADGKDRYLAVFNLGESSGTLEVAWKELGFPAMRGPCATSGAGRTWARTSGCGSPWRPTRALSSRCPRRDHRAGGQRISTRRGFALRPARFA